MTIRYPKKTFANFVRHFLSFPFIFLPFIPMMVLHLCIEIYQLVAFPLYGLKKFTWTKYVSFDRERLTYLKGIQWWYCAYCTYMNGILAYFVVVAGKTEEYWCNVIHKDIPGLIKQPHQKEFAEYGNEAEFVKRLEKRENHTFK
jgi:hypothetical protein